jgi:hypothetical protein
MIQVHIKGQGAVTLALLDRTGQALLRTRIAATGHPEIEAKTELPATIETTRGKAHVVPVVVRTTNAEQRVTFDGMDAASFSANRCRDLRFPPKAAARLTEIVAQLAKDDEEGRFLDLSVQVRRR